MREKTIIEIAMLIIAVILISIVIFMMLFYRKTSMISVEPNESFINNLVWAGRSNRKLCRIYSSIFPHPLAGETFG